jgi:hypothetical protein
MWRRDTCLGDRKQEMHIHFCLENINDIEDLTALSCTWTALPLPSCLLEMLKQLWVLLLIMVHYDY